MLYAHILGVDKDILAFKTTDRFSAINRLDGFDPGDPCLYRRFLVPVQINGSALPALLYVGEDPISGRLKHFNRDH